MTLRELMARIGDSNSPSSIAAIENDVNYCAAAMNNAPLLASALLELNKKYVSLVVDWEKAETQRGILSVQLERAEEVLRFYADRTNYDTVDGSLHVYSERGLDRKMYRSLEFGDKARAYFAQKEGDGE